MTLTEEYNGQQPSGESAFPADFEADAAHAKLINLLRSAAPTDPPPDFTRLVMSRIGSVAGEKRRFNLWLRDLIRPATSKEVAICFLLAGFFYLSLATMLYLGLQPVLEVLEVSTWFRRQPQFASAAALVFTLVGIFLMKDVRWAARTALLAASAYTLAAVVNGMQMQMLPTNPFGLAGTLCFTAGAVALGVFLAAAVIGYRRSSRPSPGNRY